MIVFLPLVFIVIVVWWMGHNTPERVGARGERRVAETLQCKLPCEYHVINGIYLPLPDGTTTQIDHVVVSRYGIFVVETKTYSGWIFGDEKSAQWMQTIYHKKSRFQNPIHQNYRHLCALSNCLGIPRRFFKNLVVFNGNCTFKTKVPPNVMRRSSLAKHILSYSVILLKEKEVSDVLSALSKWSDSIGEDRRKAHVANLKKRHSAVFMRDSIPNCPYCGKQMVLRKNRKTGKHFYGCSTYPNCKGTIKIAQ